MARIFCLLATVMVLGVDSTQDMKTPMASTVKLIEDLAKGIEADGKTEQASFDEYACWCEKTMERKANDISTAKEVIAETQTLIKKLKGEIASHGAEIQQLKKDIAQNNEAVKEATGVRNKEHQDYSTERMESEQCIGALEAATNALTGAGTKSFLQGNLHAAELLSVVAGVRTALNHKVSTQTMSNADIEVMKHFVSKPDDFVGKHTGAMSAAQLGAMSAAQLGQNPFGDYAPQSTQIQGILKGMYDAFTSDLEKDNAEEAQTQKSFEELHATKMQELATLEATLQKQETDEAAKTKKLADSEVLLDDTSADLKADSAFFEDTKQACQAKATEWSVRTRLRTEELNGMQVAIGILSSDGAKKTFESSTTTFLQLKSVHKHTEHTSARTSAYAQLKKLAAQFQSRSVAKIAVEVRTGGHFDKIIVMIDEMTALLRQEEQEDIEHRDRCENSQNANANEMADLKHEIEKTQASLDRMNREADQLKGDIGTLKGEISATEGDMSELLGLRNKEHSAFQQALKDDTDAAALLRQAIVALSKYYKNNKIPLPALVQKAPEYAKDADKPPATAWSGSNSRKSETGGILAILEMLVEDTDKEIKEGRADDADAQEKYLKQNGALQDALDSQEEAKANTESQLADLKGKIADYDKYKNEKGADKAAEESTEGSLATDCKWVTTHFQKRRDARKDEMQGLVDAKSFLASGGSGII